ncbi:exonuclease domain-containing protein [Amaricoccus tamworthensis]|uniref:3'-5' exonuclease n=1 Tax=Amaricoccus tamworthensis TaxID=57002 RepID=UPI003C7DD5D2
MGWSLRLRVLLIFMGLGVGCLIILLSGLYVGYLRAGDGNTENGFFFAGVYGGFLTFGLVTLVWWLFDLNVAKPTQGLANRLRVQAHSGVAARFDGEDARYLGDLAPAAQAVAGELHSARSDLAELVERNTTRISAEKQRLEAMLGELDQGVVMCSSRHRIVFYNDVAARCLPVPGGANLGRMLSEHLDMGPVEEAVARLSDPEGAEVPVRFKCALRSSDGALVCELYRDPDGTGPRPGYMLTFRPEKPVGSLAARERRGVTYDFSLLDEVPDCDVAAARLEDLSFVVFDTETTGLFPFQGDELVQVAGMRVVRGKPVHTEVFDTLVNPGRNIPAVSTGVHGISDEMVKDAPGPVEAVADFRRYVGDAVLVAHNAPFDLAFLRRAGKERGYAFDIPVLDTVLLSAVVFGETASHTLDDLAQRLDVVIPEDKRHTALGDAMATTEVFLKLLPVLRSRGITTFGEAVEAMRRHRRLLKDSN